MIAIVDTWGWEAGWRVLGVIALLMVYPTALIMRRQPEDHGLHPDGKSDEEMRTGRGAAAVADFANSFTRSEALRTSSFYMVVIAFGLSGAGLMTMLLQTIPFLTDLGYSRTTAVWVLSGSAIPAALSKPAWGLLAERYHPRRLSAISFLLLSGGVLMLLFGGHSGSTPPLVLSAVILGIGWGGIIPLSETVWASYFGRRYLGSVRSVAMPFSLLFSGGTPLLVSFYFDRVGNYDGALVAVAGTWALAAGIILLSRNPTLPRRLYDGGSQPAAAPPPPADGPAAPAGPERPAPPRPRRRDYMGDGQARPVRDYMQPGVSAPLDGGAPAESRPRPAPVARRPGA